MTGQGGREPFPDWRGRGMGGGWDSMRLVILSGQFWGGKPEDPAMGGGAGGWGAPHLRPGSLSQGFRERRHGELSLRLTC